MASDSTHWNSIFSAKSDQELGWYEDDLSQTLKFARLAGISQQHRVFLPGAGTSGLVDALRAYGCEMVLNDISDEALNKLAQRVGSDRCTYLHHNMADPLPTPFEIDLWIDRAVLHFLLTDREITGYFDNLRASVKNGGYVLLAEFSKQGAEKCAGLPIRQYSLEDMQTRLGAEFELIKGEAYTFINPFDQARPYVYGLFKRISQ